ncbi:MAG: DUF2500 family protein [Clostridia bacterium]|nr:DUF2500 family protein [Clostridia bacterium]
MLANVINIMSIAFLVLCWVLIVKRFLVNQFAPVKSVKAEVFDKYQPNTVSRIPKMWKRERYIVVFVAREKKLSFCVSEFSYGNYKVKDKGTLKYQGNKIISFD